jgi:hypothetical protein
MQNKESYYPYVDGVGSLRMIDGVVRVDFVVITEIEDDQVKAHRSTGVAMSLSAAIKLKDQLEKMLVDLKERGSAQNSGRKELPQ